jgi:hypothetical protein
MKQLTALTIAVVMLFAVTFANAAEKLQSGLQKGAGIGPFYVTKCAGADKDGVAIGKNLCYRCKNGRRPQVMVFTRSSDPKVIALIKGLDKALTANSDSELRAFVNVLGESKDEATNAAKALAKSTAAKNIPFVVPNENENGPDDYGLNSKAEVTIIIASNSKVRSNVAVGKASKLNVDEVIKKVTAALK